MFVTRGRTACSILNCSKYNVFRPRIPFKHSIGLQSRWLSRRASTSSRIPNSILFLTLSISMGAAVSQVNWADSRRKEEVSLPQDDDVELLIEEKDEKLQSKAYDQPSNSSVLWRIWLFIKQDYILLFAITATTICSAFVNIQIPLIMGSIVSIIQHPATYSLVALRTASLRLLALFATGGTLAFIDIYLVSLLGERMSQRVRKALYTSLLNKPISFYDARMASELISRIGGDVSDFKHSFKQTLTTGLRALVQSLGSIYALLGLSSHLTFTLASTMPVLYAFMNAYGAYLRILSRDAKMKESRALDGAGECLSNVKTVKAFTALPYESSKFEQQLQEAGRASTRLGMHIGLFQGLQNLFIGSMVLSVLYMGGIQVSEGTLSGGELMSFMVALQNTQKSLASLGVLVGTSSKAASAATRVFEYIDTPLTAATHIPVPRNADIVFQEVGFVYPTRPHHPVLSKFSLTVPHGSVVALCGASGCGKSTIASLLERFYTPSSGRILLDDTDIAELDLDALRGKIGYGRRDATMEEVRAAARDANCHDFIMQFRDGYDTVVGERGATLSGGQRQRIAIARALLKNPEILVLDEATSALDTESEAIVQQALDKCVQGRTVLVIAHRLSTIKNADLILCLGPKGKILESGKHDELLRKRGAYYDMYNQKSQL